MVHFSFNALDEETEPHTSQWAESEASQTGVWLILSELTRFQLLTAQSVGQSIASKAAAKAKQVKPETTAKSGDGLMGGILPWWEQVASVCYSMFHVCHYDF